MFIKLANPSLKRQTELKLLKLNIGVWISLVLIQVVKRKLRLQAGLIYISGFDSQTQKLQPLKHHI